jgi:hypothetical protein
MLKKLALSLCAVLALGSAAFAGTESYKSSKNVMQQPACPEWYATNEWNLNIWGTYAFTGTEWRDDRYLGVDHAWGGGIDAKYFFARYFGLGIEAYGLHLNNGGGQTFFLNNGLIERLSPNDRSAAGGVLGTFTFRYPIPCTRFAPYGFAGGGGMWGSGGRDQDFFDGTTGALLGTRSRDDSGKFVGQFGGGFEVRITPHVGWTNDFSWNVVDGPKNNFGMVRSGINFAF